jgi:hypothetical protein
MKTTPEKLTVWRTKPMEIDIDFDSLEQRSLLKQRLNALNDWLYRSLQSNCLWGVVVAKQHYDSLLEKYNRPSI